VSRLGIAIAAGCAAALGAVAATIWVGASVREDTVVAHPYEDGLRQDAERQARAALGLSVWLPGQHDADARPLLFELKDRAGRPLVDAAVTVQLSRAETSRGELGAPARALGGGRWEADLAFPSPGAWDVRFDVVREGRRVRMERRVLVRAACDLGAGPCARAIEGGGEVTLELGPRPLRTMAELAVRVTVREPAAATTPTSTSTSTRTSTSTATVTVSFSMPGMTMGENRSTLAAAGAGTYEGKAVLVRCASGRRDWTAEVELAYPDGARRTLRFPLTLPEERR